MQSRQLSTSLLRATASTPLPFLIPAFATRPSAALAITLRSRTFTSNAVLSADADTAREPAPTATATPEKPQQPYSKDAISAQLEGLLQSASPPRKRGRTSRASDMQDGLAVAMGLGKEYTHTPTRSNIPKVPQAPPPVRLDSFVGRSIEVSDRNGLAAALRNLESQLARNNVKKDARMQKYHERPGLKRKRLRIERWRLRFKEGFRATVEKVQKMRKMGW